MSPLDGGAACASRTPTVLLASFIALASLPACGQGRAPAAPQPDAGPRVDSSAPPTDGATGDAGYTRPGAPRLPPADLELVLPFEGPERSVFVDVEARPGKLDVHLSIDTTGSFGGEIDALQSDILDTIVPAIQDRVSDVTFGVSRFEDFPADPFGAEADRPFALLTALTTRSTRIASAVAALDSPLGSGGDMSEAGYEALYQIATGEGYRARGVAWVQPFAGGAAPGGGVLGGVGFREDAMHVIVHATDAPAHRNSDYGDIFPGTHGRTDALDALRALDVRVVGIASDLGARPQLEDLALSTGAEIAPTSGSCPTGVGGSAREPIAGRCPLVFDARADGTGVSEAVVDGIVGLVDAIRYDEVYGRTAGDRFSFVKAIIAAEASVSGTTPPGVTDAHPAGDGFVDTFTGVHVGTVLRFELRFQNTSIRAEDYDQIFMVTVEIVGDEDVLERRVVRIRVPLTRQDASVTDSAVTDGGAADGGAADSAVADGGAADSGGGV